MVWAAALLPTALSIPLSKCLSLFQTGCTTSRSFSLANQTKTLIHKDIAKPQVLLLSLFLIFLPHLQVNEFENHDGVNLLKPSLETVILLNALDTEQSACLQPNIFR